MSPTTRRDFTLAALATSVLAPACVSKPAAAADPAEDARIGVLLNDWVEVRKQSPGAALAVSDARGIRAYARGVLGISDPRPVNGDTVFRIASLTKVFTGLLLSDAILRGEMKLSDPVRIYLPAGVKLPTRDGREILLIDLATHTTGLPQEIPNADEIARNLGPDPRKPLYDFLATFELPRPIGQTWTYSNLNYALIGHALENRTGLAHEKLLAERVTGPLGMHSTAVSMTPGMKARRASPHVDGTTPGVEWNKWWAVGAGSMHSTVSDLCIFLSAASGLKQTKLAPAFAAMLQTTRPAPFLGGDQAIGWGIDRSFGPPRIMFGGRNGGFTSTMMYDPATKRGVAAICNSTLVIDSVGREAFSPGYMAFAAKAEAAAAAASGGLPPDPVLDRVAGRYALVGPLADAKIAAGEVFDFRRVESGFAVVMPRYPRAPLKQTGEGVFIIDGFQVKFVFSAGQGPAAEVTVTMAGQTVRAVRQ